MVEIQVIVPSRNMDAVADGLVEITAAIDRLAPDTVAHGVLGGHHGYGAHFENDVFVMRPFYWGDCDCGADERGDKWHAANPHKADCFRTVLHARFAKYDEESGWNALEEEGRAADLMEEHVEEVDFGTLCTRTRTAKGDDHHKRWCRAHDRRTKAHARLTRELYLERGLGPELYQWLCTCGVDERATEYFATEGHYPTCALELPNFRHKATGFEVRWYKYIGRDMETKGECDWHAVLRECLQSLPTQERG